MSINGLEWVVLAVLALALVGPNRLPEYAQGLARLIRKGRDFALGAREQVRTELGPEFDEVDWQKYDPRRYHPRQIVRNALNEAWEDTGDQPTVKPVSASMSATMGAGSRAAAAGVTAASRSGPTAAPPTGGKAAARTAAAQRTTSLRPARSPRPAVLDAAPGASPAPATWGAFSAGVVSPPDYDADAT